MEPRTFEVAGRLRLRVRIRSGDIRVSTTDSDTATVHVTGERKADDITIEHDRSGSTTRLSVLQRGKGSGWGFRGDGLQIEVGVPDTAIAEITSGSGDLAVEGPLGSLSFQSGSGDARVATVNGSVRMKSASGDVEIGAVDGDLSLTTASGDVRVGIVRGTLDARSASGDVEIGALAGDGQVATASGDVAIGCASADLSVRSVSGDIDVGVPAGLRVWFDLSSTSGDTEFGLEPVDDRESEGGEGTTPEIRAVTVSGDIRIRRAQGGDVSRAG